MKLIGAALFLFALFTASVGSTVAAPMEENPSQVCVNNEVPTPFGPLEVPSHGGCVSSVATGELSTAAYIANCKVIRAEDPEAFYGDVALNPGTYGFGGTLGSCAEVLESYHTGEYFQQ